MLKKILIILNLTFMFSCVTNNNSSSESAQSLFIKKSLQIVNYKESKLNTLKEEKIFLESKYEQPSPNKSFIKKYNVETNVIDGRSVYIISPKKGLTETTILYLHGGAYMANFLPIHWNFISKIIDNTGVKVIAPDYPLAPESTWKDAFRMLESIDKTILINNDKVIFMGDSAGAGLALAWSMELKNRQLRTPEQLILLSPWLDISMNNPDINTIEEIDPFLSKEALQIAGKYWTGHIDTCNWQVSPIYGDFKNLPPITLFTGTADILNADARLLKNKIEESGNSLDYREYHSMIHDWMFFNIPETEVCLNEIVSLLNNL